MTQIIQYFVSFEAAAFILAALVHFGAIAHGYEHLKAGIAETVIGSVLASGLAWVWMHPRVTRGVGLAVQAFAFMGTLIGAFTVAIGIGPRTVPDIVYHIGLVGLLACGLFVSWRTPTR
jgi:hypothetical protein